MATREQLHKEVDAVPDDQLNRARVVVMPLPDEAKPEDTIDEWGNLSLMTRRSASRLMKRLSEEEAAAGLEPW